MIRFVTLISTILIAGSVWAAESIDIAAVVNDKVISTLDLNERVALVMGTTGIPDTNENRARLTPQILRQLVDEQLQLDDGKNNGISISDERVKEGTSQIEKQSGKPEGSLEEFLIMRGLSKASFESQVRAQMTWSEIVMKKIRPRIHVTDQEVARYVARKTSPSASRIPHPAAAGPLPKQIKIAVLQLPVDSAKNESKIKAIAMKLADAIHSGAKFEAVASQFSSSTGNTHIAEPFWVETSQIDPLIVRALSGVPKGGVALPVRTANGWQIVKLVDFKQAAPGSKPAAAVEAPPSEAEPRAEMAYKQILMRLKPDAQEKEAELLLKLAREVAKSPGKCDDNSMAGAGDLAALDFTVTLNRAVSDDMPDKLRDLLMMMKVGGVSQPVVTPEGIRLFMLCERIDLPDVKGADIARADTSDTSTRQTILQQKLELEAQKYMRDLRREAFIEIRAPQ